MTKTDGNFARQFLGKFKTTKMRAHNTAEPYKVQTPFLEGLGPRFAEMIHALQGQEFVIDEWYEDQTLQCFLHGLASRFRELPKLPAFDVRPTEDQAIAMVKVWCFGEEWELPELQNRALEHLVHIHQEADDFFDPIILATALEKTAINSALAALLIDIALFELPQQVADDKEHKLRPTLRKLMQHEGFFERWLIATKDVCVGRKNDSDDPMLKMKLKMKVRAESYMVVSQGKNSGVKDEKETRKRERDSSEPGHGEKSEDEDDEIKAVMKSRFVKRRRDE